MLDKGIIGPDSSDITEVNFRAKIEYWKNSKILIKSKCSDYVSSKNDDPYFRAFVMNVTLRPICYECPFKGGKSGSDITLGDFWGIQNLDSSAYDEQGTSLIITHRDFSFDTDSLNLKEEPITDIEKYNGSYFHPACYNGNRVVFFGKLDSTDDVTGLMNRCTQPSKYQQLKNLIYRKTKGTV